MKEELPQHDHYLRGHRDAEDLSKLSRKLTPSEETHSTQKDDLTSPDNDELLDVDTGALKFPQGLMENEPEKPGIFGHDPVIVIIFTLMLLFIAFITYLVYLTPAK
jgi:hypothetical protein